MYEDINIYNMFVGSFLPNWLMKRTELGSTDKLVYARLAQFAGRQGGPAYPSQELLSREVGLGRRQVIRSLSKLLDLRLIRAVRNGKKMNNSYYFLNHPWMHEDLYLDKSDVTHMSPHNPSDVTYTTHSDVTHMSHPHIRESYEENHIKKINKKKNSRVDENFNKFWEAYPKKVAKEQAKRKFFKMNPSDELLDKILDSIEKQKKNRSQIVKFNSNQPKSSNIFLPPWKHPSTWLSGGCWEDEIENIEVTNYEEKKGAPRPSNGPSDGMGEIWSELAEKFEHETQLKNYERAKHEKPELLQDDIC